MAGQNTFAEVCVLGRTQPVQSYRSQDKALGFLAHSVFKGTKIGQGLGEDEGQRAQNFS